MTVREETNLEQTLETKREELFEVVKQYGLKSERALRCSQELDRLLNIYQTMPSVNQIIAEEKESV